jgi:predicted phosphodiesterase
MMSTKNQFVTEAVKRILTELPDYPSRTLARLLIEREPKLFHTIESARGIIRTHRGANGNIAVKDCSFKRPHGHQSDGLERLPKPIAEPHTWRIVPVTFKRALIIGDMHIPFHDLDALKIALRHGKKLEVDCVILNGDVLDFYALSFWEKDPRLRNFAQEIEWGKSFLETLRDSFPKAQIIYKEGNHEERLWRYIAAHAPDLLGVRTGGGLDLLSLATLLDFASYDVRLVDNKQPIRAGAHLHILHGHEFRAPFVNPVNPARGLFLRAKCNAICGDLHQTSSHTESGLDKTMSCWSHGHLGQARPRYAPLNKWNHGFATMELDGNDWALENHKIISGKVV